MEKEPLSDMAITGSTVVEHSPHHQMVEGLGTTAAVGNRREREKTYKYYSLW